MTDQSLDDVLSFIERYPVTWVGTEGKRGHGPVLPKVTPDADDASEQCAWLTSVLNLDVKHPVIAAHHRGNAGGRGHIELPRLDAESLWFKPASHLTHGRTLVDDLVWQLTPGDGEPYPWSDAQAVKIAAVVHWLCGVYKGISARDQMRLILTTYIEAGAEVEGNTYGGSGDKYKAVVNLRPVLDRNGRPVTLHYLIDTHGPPNEPQIVIRVSDLGDVARQVLGRGLERGELNAEMEAFEWERLEVQGYSVDGRAGRVSGTHAACEVYRGPISSLYPVPEGQKA